MADLLSVVGWIARMMDDMLDFMRTRLGTQLPVKFPQCQLTSVLPAGRPKASRPPSRPPIGLGLRRIRGGRHGNAPPHGHAGEPLRVAACSNGERTIMTVRNGGAPIAREVIDPIFASLVGAGVQQGGGRNNQARLGSGLPIGREVAQDHQRRIDAVSSAASGTTFTFVLPRPSNTHRSGMSAQGANAPARRL